MNHKMVMTRLAQAIESWLQKRPPAASDSIFYVKTTVKETINPATVIRMMELDFCEQQSCEGTLSQEDRLFLTEVTEGIHLLEDERYEMPLPFREVDPQLPNNETVAAHRLKNLKGRLVKNPKYHNNFVDFMNNLINSGSAERVPETGLHKRDGNILYISHHWMYHPKKTW